MTGFSSIIRRISVLFQGFLVNKEKFKQSYVLLEFSSEEKKKVYAVDFISILTQEKQQWHSC